VSFTAARIRLMAERARLTSARARLTIARARLTTARAELVVARTSQPRSRAELRGRARHVPGAMARPRRARRSVTPPPSSFIVSRSKLQRASDELERSRTSPSAVAVPSPIAARNVTRAAAGSQ
jgi:hypothetical protein